MFSKTSSNTPQPTPTPTGSATPPTPPQNAVAPEPPRPVSTPRGPKAPSIIGPDMTLEGDIAGASEIQVDGKIKGDIRVEHVTVGDGGTVEGGIYAEAVEVRGKVVGSITAKQVRLYGACHVDGDITHEQLAMETGAFFQGRSLRLQRPAHAAQAAAAPKVEPPREAAPSASTNSAKPASAPATPAS
jgi:cytoskeletal protein CcmA (bactofilin family)